jgi:hypothetical protein
MVVDNHEYYQTDGAQRPRGSAAITGSEVRATTGERGTSDHGERGTSDHGEPDATGRAGRDWESRTRLGELVLDDMSSRTGSANFFKKIIFRLLKFFLRHPTEYAVLAATTNGTHTAKGEKSCNAMVLDNHEYYQTKGNRLGPEAASGPRGSEVRATTGERPRGAGRDWESSSWTTCRLGRDPPTFLKKIIFKTF